MRGLLVALFAFWSTLAFAQVKVEVRPEKPSFLDGEPIYVVADITNIGEYRIGYGPVGHDLTLTMKGLEPYEWRNGCGALSRFLAIAAGGVDHPPTFEPGRTVSLRYVLRGYRPKPGSHEIRISGKAPVRWFMGGYVNVPPPSPIPHQPSDPVEGWEVDRTLAIVVKSATEEQLRAALEPLVVAAKSFLQPEGYLARDGLYEMAPSFLVDTIAELASHPNFRSPAAFLALADINTSESRAHLRRLHDETPDLEIRRSIAWALAVTANVENVDFFASLLPGRSTPQDDGIRGTALRALDCIGTGGDKVANALAGMLQSPDDYLRTESLRLLGRTRSRLAVPAIIAAAAGDKQMFLSSCEPLRTLTHYEWCDTNLPSIEAYVAQPKHWPRWWVRNQGRVRIYGPEEVPPENTKLPMVR